MTDMVAMFEVTAAEDSLAVRRIDTGAAYRVRKRGFTGPVGMLWSRRFEVIDEGGAPLFQAVKGFTASYPRASLVERHKETFVVTYGSGTFSGAYHITSETYGVAGSLLDDSFDVTINGEVAGHVAAHRGGGRTVYAVSVAEGAERVLGPVCAIAVYRMRTKPRLEPGANEE